jgi:hypothetical protein
MIARAILSLGALSLSLPTATAVPVAVALARTAAPEAHRTGGARPLMAAPRTATPAAMSRTAIVGRLANGEVRHHTCRLWNVALGTG